jgi:hypothetical protein
MIREPVIGALLLLSCARPVPVEVLGIDARVAPILPAVEAQFYGRSVDSPRDPLVASVIESAGLVWEESLSGAAAGIALSRQPASLDGASWSAVVAGYPYSVVNLVQGETLPGAWPEGLVEAIVQSMQPGDDLGLVRARRGEVDIWIGLIGRPAVQLETFPKELAPGDQLNLVSTQPARFTLVSPTGRLQRGELPARPTLSENGEWWLQVTGSQADDVHALPLFVGLSTPETPLIELPGQPISTVEAAEEEASLLLNDIRAQFDLRELQLDGTLSTLALQPLALFQEGDWDAEIGVDRLRTAGFVGEETTQVVCVGSTVARCLVEIMDSPLLRRGILQPEIGIHGLAAAVDSSGVDLVINLASQ